MVEIKNNIHSDFKRQWVFLCLFVLIGLSSFINGEPTPCACNGNLVKQQKTASGTGELSGLIMDKSGGQPIKKAIVCIKLDKQVIARTKTNSKGRFKINGINTGNYSLNVCSEGNPPMQIGGILIQRDKPFYLNVFLNE